MESAPMSDYASAAHAQKVEADLRALQDSHRLAIHQWEIPLSRQGNSAFDTPDYLKTLNRPADQICTHLKEGKPLPEYSMTLLPSTRSKRSVKPYSFSPDDFASAGYIVDLSQDRPHPAKVIKASTGNLNSGEDLFEKDLRFDNKSDCASLNRFYWQFFTERQLKKQIAGNPHYTEKQLDLLGTNLEKPQLSSKRFVTEPPLHQHPYPILDHNEILVAATVSHLKAISFPHYEVASTKNTDEYLDPYHTQFTAEEHKAILELNAAVQGLDHLDRGMDLPVMFYHINGSQQNQITFFAQGRAVLTEKAMSALKILQDHQTLHHLDTEFEDLQILAARVEKTLHIDMYAPLEGLTPSITHPDVRIDAPIHDGSVTPHEISTLKNTPSAGRIP